LNDTDVILINEGQFFADIYEFALNMVETRGKTVHICGLDGDFQRNKFGKLLDLIPYADDVVKLKSRCHVCSKSAAFSHRLSGEVEQVVIGSDNYIPLCRGCYIKMNTKT
jgi:thymidine kinase